MSISYAHVNKRLCPVICPTSDSTSAASVTPLNTPSSFMIGVPDRWPWKLSSRSSSSSSSGARLCVRRSEIMVHLLPRLEAVRDHPLSSRSRQDEGVSQREGEVAVIGRVEEATLGVGA